MSDPSVHSLPPLEQPLPLRRVLVASFLDGSGANVALRAARLPLARGARVTLLHVVHPWPPRRPMPPLQARHALQRVAAEAREAAAAAANVDVDVVPVLADGWPATEILRIAWQSRAEVVLVGPPALRRGGTARAIIFRVLRRAELPVLVVRRHPAEPYDQVLCSVDATATAIQTVDLALRLASPMPRVTLFHACHAPFQAWMGSFAPEIQQDARERLERLARCAAGVARVRAWIRTGERELEMMRAALRTRVDLVVVGSRGRSAVARALFGSGAEWVAAHAPFDVAIAPPHRLALASR